MKVLGWLGKSLPWFMLMLVGAGCILQTTAPPTILTVLAAASLSSPFTDLGRQFEADHPGVKVRFSFAGSQQLLQQLEQGAPADVFASASLSYMEAAVKTQRVAAGSPRPFAHNRLVVITPKNNPSGIAGLIDLAKPGLKLDLAAREVPAGQYALDVLDKASADAGFGPNFKAQVLKNVVSYETNVKAVLTKVALGEADAGIVYASDGAGDAVARVGLLEIPVNFNVVAIYPIAAVAGSANPILAQAFVDLVLSKPGQDALVKNGFLP
jgi:molybdate transport system substrate-binding protein